MQAFMGWVASEDISNLDIYDVGIVNMHRGSGASDHIGTTFLQPDTR